jgi:hypothetical protein
VKAGRLKEGRSYSPPGFRFRLQSAVVRSVGILVAAALCASAADFPMTLVSEDEAEPIHSAILRKEAWTQDSVRRLRAEAEKRLKEGPWSVTYDRPPGLPLDVHDYYSEAPYWWPDPANPGGPYIRKDGQVNPARFIANRNELVAMCDAVFTLGTAAFLLDDNRYAQRAARVINIWFVNSKTRMNPSLEYSQAVPGLNNGRGTGIIEGRCLIRAIQGMEFLAGTDAWDAKDQGAVRKWFEDYLHWLTQSRNGIEERASGNNHASWWTAQVAGVATFVEDAASRDMAFAYYRDRLLPKQIRPDGGAPREEARTRSLTYSAFNLEALALTCRIAQVQGKDLWTVRARNGATIATIIDNLEPYFADPRKWAREQTTEFQTDSLYALAFAGMGLKKPEYVELFRKLERSESAWLSLVDLLVNRWEAAAHQTRH